MNNYFECYGRGEPLILLHGNGEDLTYFKNQIPVFAKYFKVYALDTRGHGRSPRAEGAFTIRRFAQDLYIFMCRHKINKAHILGFSDGANIAMYFALAHPEMVDKLILNGGNAFPAGLKAYFNLPCQIGYRLLKPIPKKPPAIAHFTELLGLMALEPQLTAEHLAHISAPTLVLAGTKDIVKAEHTRLIAKSIPDSRLKILKGGHCLGTEVPQVYNETVLRFLRFYTQRKPRNERE